MASSTLIRRINLTSGFVRDQDWTDPANPIPDTVRPMWVLRPEVTFAFVGKDGTEVDAAGQDVGFLKINAWVATEVGGEIVRGLDIEERVSVSVSARISVTAQGLIPGSKAWLNIENLGEVGTLPALWVYILSGARPL
jgi:hypothetical protein